ncbi:alpha/beta fold hydrolase [Massilia sp. S19_KUP03_FR1]|uniref:alpha/beta fold hydrolase n=1 Tax=Massilia sp. S19_KUP03_FR1 TaxID=3025503 RepID=UPI002FCD8E0B
MKTTLLFAALLALATPAFATQPVANRYAATIAPVERFDSGVLSVERHGNKGRPLILVPGLASGAWAWQSVLRDLAPDYTLYVVTLPGFDGRAFPPGAGLDAARAGLLELIKARKLDRPVLIGHSLGATLAFAVAEAAPQAVGGVVAIDGLPVFPGTEAMPPAERAAMAANMKARMAAVDPALFASQQQAYMRTIGVRDMAQADQLALLSARSDPAATGVYMAELLALDLRPGLGQITAPVLVLAPWFDQNPMYGRATPEAKAAWYQSLLAGAPHLQVLPVPDARHFVMFDQPQRVNTMLRAYLQGL